MSAKLFIEGAATGPDSKELQIRCRQGFRKLFAKCDFPSQAALIACGGRQNTYKKFSTAHKHAPGQGFVGMLIDSEDPVSDIETTWAHLKQRDGWETPVGAIDEQVLLMTTCMETWIVSDQPALHAYYGADLQSNALPNLHEVESRDRHVIQRSLVHATRNCRNTFQKGKRSFELLERLQPEELRKHLPSFVRCERILREKL